MRSQLDDINFALGDIVREFRQLKAPSATPASTANPPPLSTPTPTTPAPPRSRLKPATPTEYDGNRTKGRAFYNSCMLYTKLCASEFPDDEAKINWVISYMKGGRAAVWADRTIRYEQNNGFPRFISWNDFAAAFGDAFFPENEAVDARMKLESAQYFQGKRSVDAYVDEFEDLVELSGYTDKLTIVVKFRRGLVDYSWQSKIKLRRWQRIGPTTTTQSAGMPSVAAARAGTFQKVERVRVINYVKSRE
jgi:hypothetical protein